MRKVCVLGGNGFIGKNLIKKLIVNGKYQVVSFDRLFSESEIKDAERNANVKLFKGDFFNSSDLKKIVEECDILVHSLCTINPGNSNEKYMFAYTHDLIKTIELCDLCSRYKKRLVFISSGGTVYGNQNVLPIPEDSVTNPINHYGSLKLSTEVILRTFITQQNADIVIARIANVYGPGQQYEKGVGFIDAVIKCAIEDKPAEVFGDGNIIRDYVYVDDACKMLIALMDYEGEDRVFNLSTSVGSSQNDVINIVRKRFPKLKVNYHENRIVDLEAVVLSNDRIKKVYTDDIMGIQDGIEKFIDYRLKNI